MTCISAIARKFLLAIAGTCLMLEPAWADIPPMIRKFQKKDYVFGSVKITQSFDSRRNPMQPESKLQLKDRGRLLLTLNGMAFGSFHGSKDGEVFVGLSNSGWPSSAVIIFDRRGTVLFVAHHGLSEFEYCAESPTFIKEWYDEGRPEVQFSKIGPAAYDLERITLRNCKGETVGLLEVVEKASLRARGQHQQRSEAPAAIAVD